MFDGQAGDSDLLQANCLQRPELSVEIISPDVMNYILLPSEFTETEVPHPRPACSPQLCPMCDFSKIVRSNGDVSETLRQIISVQKEVEEYHDVTHKIVQQLYLLRWSLKSNPRPADERLTFIIQDMHFAMRAGDHAAVEESLRAALRNALQDHRELEIKRRDLERVVITICSLSYTRS